MDDPNRGIIEEFRTNEGKVGGFFEGVPLLLLHHVGAKTGAERVTPVMYRSLDTGYAVFASKAGADSHPQWFHNLKANPEIKIEVGSELIAVTARIAGDGERDHIWGEHKKDYPTFAEYEHKTERTIPVIVLEPLEPTG